MIIGIGSDIIDIRRIEKLCLKFGKKFEERIFTEAEIARANSRSITKTATLAKRFAAKEAFAKAIGTGIGKISWKEIEIKNNDDGRPFIELSGNALNTLNNISSSNKKIKIDLTVSDEYPMAIAFVVISA